MIDLTELPLDYFVVLRREANDDTQGAPFFLSAVLMREPPPDGWPEGGQHAFEDRCVSAVTSHVGDEEMLFSLARVMIKGYT